jgi:ankyrin repeat protein
MNNQDLIDIYSRLSSQERVNSLKKYIQCHGSHTINTIRGTHGHSLLAIAARNADLPFAKLLVSNGADVNHGDNYTPTLIYVVVFNQYFDKSNNIALVQFLLDSGGDPLYASPLVSSLHDCPWDIVLHNQYDDLDELFRRDVKTRVSLAITVISQCPGINVCYFDASALLQHLSEYLILTKPGLFWPVDTS